MTTVADYIKRTVDAAPPLSDEQRERLRAILVGGTAAPAIPRLDRVAPRVRKCALYRYFDTDGALLYVGISVEPETRGRSHSRRSAFMEFSVRQTTDWFDSEAEARAAERAAIHDEQPLFNRVGTDADRDQRLLAYLITHNAHHLLRLP